MIETTVGYEKNFTCRVTYKDLLDMLPSWIGAFWREITFFLSY